MVAVHPQRGCGTAAVHHGVAGDPRTSRLSQEEEEEEVTSSPAVVQRTTESIQPPALCSSLTLPLIFPPTFISNRAGLHYGSSHELASQWPAFSPTAALYRQLPPPYLAETRPQFAPDVYGLCTDQSLDGLLRRYQGKMCSQYAGGIVINIGAVIPRRAASVSPVHPLFTLPDSIHRRSEPKQLSIEA